LNEKKNDLNVTRVRGGGHLQGSGKIRPETDGKNWEVKKIKEGLWFTARAEPSGERSAKREREESPKGERGLLQDNRYGGQIGGIHEKKAKRREKWGSGKR